MGFRSIATGSNPTGGTGPQTITVSVPTGVADGDVMTAAIYTVVGATTLSPSTPAGWTVIGTTNGNASAGIITLYYRVASSEPANYTWSVGSGANTVSLILGYICAYDAGSLVADTSDNVFHDSVTSPDTLSIGTLTNPGTTDVFLHTAFIARGGSAAPGVTVDAALTERGRVAAGAFFDGFKLVAADEEWVSASAYPSRSYVVTVSSGLIWDGMIRTNLFAVVAAGSGGDAWAWVG